MKPEDHLKWMIGDLAFQVANYKGYSEELESLVSNLKAEVEKLKDEHGKADH